MTANLLFAVGTLLAWVGAIALVMVIFAKEGRALKAVVAGVCFLAAAVTPAFQGGLAIPLVWIVMPFAGWAALTCAVFLGVRLFQSAIAGSWRELVRAWPWFVGAILFLVAFRLEPENKIEILRGKIALGSAGLGAIVAFGVAAVVVMTLLGKRAKMFGTHLALLAGSVIFGLPFLWLVLTSFKEDRDMSSANGIVWIPKVQRTVPYMDPQNPLLEGVYRGNWIQSTLIGRTSDGSYIVEVQRPLSLRGLSVVAKPSSFKVVPEDALVVKGEGFTGFVVRQMDDGRQIVRFLTPPNLKDREQAFLPSKLEPIRDVGLRTENYRDAVEAMPPETQRGLVYLKNTVTIVVLSVIGTLLSSSLVAYGFARLRFPGRDVLFKILLATMMLPAAVTLLPQFLLFRSFGWVDTLYPIWVPAFFGAAFNVFLLRQFFSQIPAELEEAGKIDGAGVLRSFWTLMLPQVKPALAVVAIWTFIGGWNNFMGPLIYVNNPENMPLSYALQLFQSERGGEPGLMMAFATLTTIPVIALFFFAQRYFIEGVTLSGLGGR